MKKDDDERRFPLIPDAGFGEARLGAGETGPSVDEFPSDRSSLRAALLQQEIECASGLPAFSSVAARIDAQPSALNAPYPSSGLFRALLSPRPSPWPASPSGLPASRLFCRMP